MALVEIGIETLDGSPTPKVKEEVLALCDLVSPSYIKSTERRVLRPIPIANSAHFASLFQPYYITLDTNSFSSLRITLVDNNLNKLDSNEGWPDDTKAVLSCTLHFQRT